jgi:phage gpG-like protein
MSWVITALAVSSAAISARSSYISGRVQEDELKRQAEQEKLAAQSRELQRRQELNRALAANMVGMGQSGLAGEGTPASIALSSAKQVGISEGAISLTEKLRQAQLRRQGSMAAQTGKLQAASTLLQAGASLAGQAQQSQGIGGE